MPFGAWNTKKRCLAFYEIDPSGRSKDFDWQIFGENISIEKTSEIQRSQLRNTWVICFPFLHKTDLDHYSTWSLILSSVFFVTKFDLHELLIQRSDSACVPYSKMGFNTCSLFKDGIQHVLPAIFGDQLWDYFVPEKMFRLLSNKIIKIKIIL